MSQEWLPANALDGWLPAALPAGVRTYRTADAALARTLHDAGAERSDNAPDVEIDAVGRLRGDARHAIVSLDASQGEGGSRLARAPRRLAGSARVRTQARSAARALRALGYGLTSTILWDFDHVLYVPGVKASRRGRPLAELLPQRALVVARRGAREQTALQAAVADAGAAIGTPLSHGWPLAREAGVIVLADAGVLNVAIGPGRRKIELQRAAETMLAGAPEVLSSRIPKPLAAGRTGLADWALEQRMPGVSPGGELAPTLIDDALDFLVALHVFDQGPVAGAPIRDDARVLAAVCVEPRSAQRLELLGDWLEAELADIPRGPGHGDFWTRNLLAIDGRLTGVIDWDGASRRRLPLLDLLHLLLSAHQERTRAYLGQALVDHLMPRLRSGADDVVARYLRRIGLELSPDRLDQLAVAYWLDRMALEVSHFADRARRPVWMRRNVDEVVEALAGSMLRGSVPVQLAARDR